MIDRTLQQAREAYEQDVLKHPNYHDGAPRKTWDELDSLCKESWCRHPLVQFDEASREAWEERAAIAEYDGGLSRKDAEALAWKSLEKIHKP